MEGCSGEGGLSWPMALLYLAARCQPQTSAQPQNAPAPRPPIQRPSLPRPLGDTARLRPPLEPRPGASLTTPRSALARPLPFRLSFPSPVRSGPRPARPSPPTWVLRMRRSAEERFSPSSCSMLCSIAAGERVQ